MIDFPWLMYIAMSKLGFTLREYGLMTFGLWIDLFETYKRQSNFETNKGIYALNEEPKIDSIDAI